MVQGTVALLQHLDPLIWGKCAVGATLQAAANPPVSHVPIKLALDRSGSDPDDSFHRVLR